MKEIWILGATGRCGQAVAKRLSARGFQLVLVGRDQARLEAVANGARVVVADGVPAIARELAASQAAVVVNTVGPFHETGVAIARACPPGCHYADLSNELFATRDLLALHDEAVAAGKCLVSGAGWGVLGTESVVLKLCEGQPPAARVRVDMVPALGESGVVGSTLAATIVDSIAAGGWRYEGGRLVRARIAGDFERFVLPDGGAIATVAAPTAELEAAHRASQAPTVVSASSEVPANPLAGLAMTILSALLANKPVRDFMVAQLAKVTVEAGTRTHSWAHARIDWPDGTRREGWLRAPEGMVFTAAALAEVATRLANGQGQPGAYTPGALFGVGLAEAAGGTFLS